MGVPGALCKIITTCIAPLSVTINYAPVLSPHYITHHYVRILYHYIFSCPADSSIGDLVTH